MAKILLDFNQISVDTIRNLEYTSNRHPSLDETRIALLTKVVNLKIKLRTERTDEIIICIDNKLKSYWRTEFFSFYKKGRRAKREADKFDWNQFFINYNIILKEFSEFLPFKIISIPGVEADDSIAVLTRIFGANEKITVVSSDRDFLQLVNLCEKYKQWSPFHKKFIDSESRNYNLLEHIIRGDQSDEIPNIMSDDDAIINPHKRQSTIRTSKLNEWMSLGDINCPEKFCPSSESLRKFIRNRQLIDFTQIPDDIYKKIAETYKDTMPGKGVFSYLTKNKMMSILYKGDF